MKIFYAVQATGNGHISRAMELIPHLQRYGTVDVFLSGDNSHLAMDAPVEYRSRGMSLYYNATGGLDYWRIARNFQPLRLRREINDLPVEKYDLVINDFEFITAAACARKKIPSVQLGHQASFQSALTPRPAGKSWIGECVLKNYAKATNYIGLHFDRYDDFIFPPVIKKDILNAEPVDLGHITVYLPSCSESYQERLFSTMRDLRFHIFSRETKQPRENGNIHFFPVNRQYFNESLVTCTGIVTGAGFETPAEALYLGKKVLVIPIRGQYEQQCNAAALEKIGVSCLKKIDSTFPALIRQWQQEKKRYTVTYRQTIPALLERLFAQYESTRQRTREDAPDLAISLQELLALHMTK